MPENPAPMITTSLYNTRLLQPMMIDFIPRRGHERRYVWSEVVQRKIPESQVGTCGNQTTCVGHDGDFTTPLLLAKHAEPFEIQSPAAKYGLR